MCVSINYMKKVLKVLKKYTYAVNLKQSFFVSAMMESFFVSAMMQCIPK